MIPPIRIIIAPHLRLSAFFWNTTSYTTFFKDPIWIIFHLSIADTISMVPFSPEEYLFQAHSWASSYEQLAEDFPFQLERTATSARSFNSSGVAIEQWRKQIGGLKTPVPSLIRCLTEPFCAVSQNSPGRTGPSRSQQEYTQQCSFYYQLLYLLVSLCYSPPGAFWDHLQSKPIMMTSLSWGQLLGEPKVTHCLCNMLLWLFSLEFHLAWEIFIGENG